MPRRILIVGALMLAVALAVNIASGSDAKKGPPTVVITETATARFYGPGPANLGLDAFNIDTVVTGTRTTTNDAAGSHTEDAWFDQFTLYDMVSGEAVLSCSASGSLPADSVGIANDLQLATVDATALSMQPAGDATTGLNDDVLCPGLSLRVLLDWHASGPASVNEHGQSAGACRARNASVAATASGVTLNSPATLSPTVINFGPSVEGSISREIVGRGKCD